MSQNWTARCVIVKNDISSADNKLFQIFQINPIPDSRSGKSWNVSSGKFLLNWSNKPENRDFFGFPDYPDLGSRNSFVKNLSLTKTDLSITFSQIGPAVSEEIGHTQYTCRQIDIVLLCSILMKMSCLQFNTTYNYYTTLK